VVHVNSTYYGGGVVTILSPLTSQIARKEVDATLVLLGNVATDDPEGIEVYESLFGSRTG